MNNNYHPSLDGLRAVAVLIVLAGHGGLPYLRSGGIGVDIFFVLSGFLITGILSREAGQYGQICLRNFYARRFLRLAPCLVLVCSFVAVWSLRHGEGLPAREIAVALTYTANWARALFDADLSTLGHTWSLAIEEQYYLLWPFAILALERLTKNPLVKGLAILNLAMAVALYRCAMVGAFTASRIYFGLDTHMDGLLLGAALAYFVSAAQCRGALSPIQSKSLGYFLVPAAVTGLVLITQIMIWTNPWMGRLGFFLVAAAAFVLIADLVIGSHSLTRTVLSTKPAVYVGRISYGLYLWHFPIYQAVDSHYPNLSPEALLVAKIGISFGIAALSYYLVEIRFLALKKWFQRAPVQDRPRDSIDLAAFEARNL